jgi:hypothetical protein
MMNPHNSWKRTSGLAALILAGLLASQAARAEVMTFETSLATLAANVGYAAMPAAYQPIPYVHIGYSGMDIYNGFFQGTAYQYDHTTTSYGGTHCFNFQLTAGSAAPAVYTFDQAVGIPSVYLSSWQVAPRNTLIVRAFSDTNGTSLLYSNLVTAAYPWTGWTLFTNLASLGTNIMRLELASATNSNAFVDDMTVNGPAMGTV